MKNFNSLMALRLTLQGFIWTLIGILVINILPEVYKYTETFINNSLLHEFILFRYVVTGVIVSLFVAGMYFTDKLVFAIFDRTQVRLVVVLLCIFFSGIEILLSMHIFANREVSKLGHSPTLEIFDGSNYDRDIDNLQNEIKTIRERTPPWRQIPRSDLELMQQKNRQISDILNRKAYAQQRHDIRNQGLLDAHEEEKATARLIGKTTGAGISILILIFIGFSQFLKNRKTYINLGEPTKVIIEEQNANLHTVYRQNSIYNVVERKLSPVVNVSQFLQNSSPEPVQAIVDKVFPTIRENALEKGRKGVLSATPSFEPFDKVSRRKRFAIKGLRKIRKRKQKVKANKPRRNCLHCNKSFILTRKDRKFCSAKCRITYHNIHGLSKKLGIK